MTGVTEKPLGWVGIIRLGLVQSAIGAVVMLATSLLNRVMVVEFALPATIPAGLVAWHYAVQLSRPVWGHGSDQGRRRTPWIVGGMAVLVIGALIAVDALAFIGENRAAGIAMSVVAYAMIGAGVGACGTSLLALLATQVAPERRSAAASITWIMMVMGIVLTAGIAGKLVDPFSVQRLALVVSGVAVVAYVATCLAVWRVEREGVNFTEPVAQSDASQSFGGSVRDIFADPAARRFTVFVFVSMLAYSMQDMILEPFAGLMFGFTPGQSTGLSGVQHSGVLIGMIIVGVGGSGFGRGTPAAMRRWIFAGCLGSAVALAGLAVAARVGPSWPLAANIAVLGFANGVFAVAAISAMMGLAGAAGPQREGVRMGVWGAAQAIAFGLGGLIGAVGVDIGRAVMGAPDRAFVIVFAAEGGLFVVAAVLSLRVTAGEKHRASITAFEEYSV